MLRTKASSGLNLIPPKFFAKGNTHPAFTGVSVGEDEYRRSVTVICKVVKEL